LVYGCKDKATTRHIQIFTSKSAWKVINLQIIGEKRGNPDRKNDAYCHEATAKEILVVRV